MRLSWRDAFATLFVFAGLALAVSVIQGWSWPLMNGARAGIISLGLTGIFACSVSGWSQEASSFSRSPFLIAGAIFGVFVLGIGIVGLFAGTMAFLVWMTAAFAALWVLTMVHRLFPEATTIERRNPA